MGGWIGVDLDGTLATYGTWSGPDHIGAPVPAMVERVKDWLAEGKEVRIFTARASVWELEPPGEKRAALYVEFVLPIIAWGEQHLGRMLRVTCVKDFSMIELWDDRAVQVEMNTGRRIG